jgi:putative endonuclease
LVLAHWTVYILKCADESLYTGITNDLDKRFAQHSAGTGAKYTRGRGPLEIIFTEVQKDRSAASKREYEIKKMPRAEKLKLTV